MRPKLTYSNVVSTLCLFLLLGGGAAYAAGHLRKNSIGSKQLKKNSVTAAKIKNNAVNSAKVRNGSLRASDFKTGQLPAGKEGPPGPKGDPGTDATALFAFVRDNAASEAVIEYGSGVTEVVEPPETAGSYLLTFDRSLQHCVAQANAGFGNPVEGVTSFLAEANATVNLKEGAADQLKVNLYPGGDAAFMVSVFC